MNNHRRLLPHTRARESHGRLKMKRKRQLLLLLLQNQPHLVGGGGDDDDDDDDDDVFLLLLLVVVSGDGCGQIVHVVVVAVVASDLS